MIDSQVIDETAFRAVMAASPAPVTVVTTLDTSSAGIAVTGTKATTGTAGAPRPVGCTVSAFMSLSLSPRMVAVALDERSSVLAHVRDAGGFGVNVLSSTQSEIAVQFARPVADRFAGLSWWRENGWPRLLGTTAWLGCRLDDVVPAGDHRLLVGEVVGAESSSLPALVYAERLFGGHSGLLSRPPTPIAAQLAAAAR